jgi:hypothetical protein
MALGSVIRIKAAPICRFVKKLEKESPLKKLRLSEKKLSSTQSKVRAEKAANAPLKPQVSMKSPS